MTNKQRSKKQGKTSPPFQCPLCCQTVFESRNKLLDHLNHLASLLNNLNCKQCNSNFLNLQDLIEHLRDDCLKNTAEQAAVTANKHITYVHCSSRNTEESATQETSFSLPAEAALSPVPVSPSCTAPSPDTEDTVEVETVVPDLTSSDPLQVDTTPAPTVLSTCSTAPISSRIKTLPRKSSILKRRQQNIKSVSKPCVLPDSVAILRRKTPDADAVIVITKIQQDKFTSISQTPKPNIEAVASSNLKQAVTYQFAPSTLDGKLINSTEVQSSAEEVLQTLEDGWNSALADHDYKNKEQSTSKEEAEGSPNTRAKKYLPWNKRRCKKMPTVLFPNLTSQQHVANNRGWPVVEEVLSKDIAMEHEVTVGTSKLSVERIIDEVEMVECSEKEARKTGADPSTFIYRCPYCKFLYNSSEEFESHCCLVQCNMCSVSFKSNSELTEHVKRHFKDKLAETNKSSAISDETLQCSTCSTDISITFAEVHKDLHKHKIKIYPCRHCHKFISLSKKSYGFHIFEHLTKNLDMIKNDPGEEFTCEHCRVSVSAAFKALHEEMHAVGFELYNCGHCRFTAHSKAVLANHNSSQHIKKPTLRCTVCLGWFTTDEALQLHKEANACRLPPNYCVEYAKAGKLGGKVVTKDLSCAFCGKCFSRRVELVKHERVHTGEKPYTCSVCDRRFRVSGSLTCHMRTHTNERPYTCPVCSKTFKNHSTLQFHKTTHEDVRAYQCPFCEKRFKTCHALFGHKRTHLKSFKCDHCSRLFNNSKDLAQHISALHEKSRDTFDCVICGASYGRGYSLILHLKTHVTLAQGDTKEVLKKMVDLGTKKKIVTKRD